MKVINNGIVRYGGLVTIKSPLTIPDFTDASEQKILSSDITDGDNFGFNVEFDGKTLVSGAPLSNNETGSAYVFTRIGNVWHEQQKLTASDAEEGARFGFNVAIDGDTLVIGAYFKDEVGERSGAAYVFTKTNGVWTETQKLVPSDGSAGDNFARGVDIDGNTIVANSILHNYNGVTQRSGAAYVFTKTDGVWTETQKLVPSDIKFEDRFSRSVAVDGDTLIAGAHYNDEGALYVFTRTNGIWSEQQKLTASDGTIGDQFGLSSSIDGNTLVIGAFLKDSGEIVDVGAAYIFTREDGVWSEQQKITASDGEFNDRYGLSVGVSGNRIVACGYLEDTGGEDAGAIYQYDQVDGVWTETVKIQASDKAAGDRFGINVSISGDIIVAGSFRNDEGGVDAGAVYIYVGSQEIKE